MNANKTAPLDLTSLSQPQRVTIMGLGLFGGGVGAARFWRELGAEVTITDTRAKEILQPALDTLADLSFTYHLGGHLEEDFRDADLVVVNPAVRPDNRFVNLAVQSGAEISTEIGLALSLFKGTVVAVTGTNGKSTTSSLIGAMLKAGNGGALVGGNLGGSLLSALKTHPSSTPLVVELSSFQLHYLPPEILTPQVAVITNLAPNHLDWHQTTREYYAAKRRILQQQGRDDIAVLNVSDPTLKTWAEECAGRVIAVAADDPGGDDACFLRREKSTTTIYIRWGGEEISLADLTTLRLPGRHNQTNALLAAAAAFALTQDRKAIAAGLANFESLPHRLEFVAEIAGVSFIDDSVSTTPESSIAALESFSRPCVLIAGGYDKGASYLELGKAIATSVCAVVLLGDSAEKIRRAISEADPSGVVTILGAGENFSRAIQLAQEACPTDGVVLLSPGCASYGMFANFVERGNAFKEIVLAQSNRSRG